MTIRKVEIERLSVTSSKPFEVVMAALNAAVGHPDMGLGHYGNTFVRYDFSTTSFQFQGFSYNTSTHATRYTSRYFRTMSSRTDGSSYSGTRRPRSAKARSELLLPRGSAQVMDQLPPQRSTRSRRTAHAERRRGGTSRP